MELFYEEYAGHDVDLVLTTRELTRMICSAHIDPSTLKDEVCDELMQDGSGAGVIFGATGGVMEAALRSAYFLVTGKNPDADAFKNVRRTREDEFTMTAEIPVSYTHLPWMQSALRSASVRKKSVLSTAAGSPI